jgi:putative PEP-CTERM system histidine kinase
MLRALSDIAVLSHAIAGLAFFLLGVSLLMHGKGQAHRRVLALACLVTTAWALVFAGYFAWTAQWAFIAALAEVLRNFGWTCLLMLLLGFFQRSKAGKFAAPVFVAGAFYGVVLLITVYVYRQVGYAVTPAQFTASTAARVACAVLGLLLVEQLYRDTRVEQRWGIKFACLGIGGLFAYDFYMYTDAMLFRHVSPEIWAARGVVDALTAPLIAISAWRNPRWTLGLTVSRRIMVRSAVLTGAAFYLLLMASAGYYLRIFGGSWGGVMQVAFSFAAGTLLIGILFSGAFRSWLRVSISKHFYHYNYDYREEWLSFTRSLSQEGPGLGERVIQALANLVESPGGAMFLVDESGNCKTAARWNMPLSSEADAANSDLCRYLEQKQWIIDLGEYEIDAGRYDDIVLPAWLRTFARAWLVIPLNLHGALLGFVVLERPRSTVNLNWEVIDLLKVAGSQAASYLAQQRSANELMIARQFESFNRMSTFVVHDIKNLVSQLSLLMSNAQRHKDNPEFQKDMIDTVGYSVQKMKLMLQKLSRKDSAGTHAPLLIEALLRQAVESKSGSEPRPVLFVVDADLMVAANWERLERIIGHIIQNAIEASARDGKVCITVARAGDGAEVTIEDNGQGMSEAFIRDRLFTPFESTKSAGMGIGVFESREYIAELGGSLTVESREMVGTVFRLVLPLHRDQQDDIDLQEETSDSK